MTDQYFQCRMQRGTFETTGWIAARGAKVGLMVELLPAGEMWQVVQVYDHALPQHLLKELQLLNRNSLPSVEPMGAPKPQVAPLKDQVAR